MPDKKKLGTAASVAVAGLIVAGGATAAITANADSSTKSNGTSYGAPGYGTGGQQGDRGHGPRGTEVTGTELAKVKAAVTAKYSGVTVEHVMKDSDGSYHVMATKGGSRVGYQVSKDLKTITVDNHQGGRGGHGGSQDKAVTGTEASKVTAAVKAKDSSVSVQSVMKDADGSYDVMATKGSTKVMFEVSKDLKTISQHSFTDRQGAQQNQAPQGEQVPA